MNHKELLKTYNEWRRGADIEQPNPTDIGKAIDSVLSENDELRASNNKLRESLRDACMYLACTVDISKYNKVLKSTPAQSLAEMKAEAVMSVMKHCHVESMLGSEIMGTVSVMEIVEYANNLKVVSDE